MMIREIFIVLAALFALSACSGGSSKGKGSTHDFNASEKMSGHFSPDQNLGKHLPEAEKKLEVWRDECKDVGVYNIPYLKAGLKVVEREDTIHLWPELTPVGEVYIFDQFVEKIISPNEFLSIQTQSDNYFSMKSRYRHEAGLRGRGSELIEIISTSPPEFKRHIEDDIRADNDDLYYVNCDRDDLPDDKQSAKATTFATLILKDETKVNGILVTERREYTNFICRLYKRSDDSLIRELKLSDRIAEERLEFYSKEYVNPFRSKCHDDAGLLSIDFTKDISGNKGILELNKSEVLSIKK